VREPFFIFTESMYIPLTLPLKRDRLFKGGEEKKPFFI
jgi:hypothetical protein